MAISFIVTIQLCFTVFYKRSVQLTKSRLIIISRHWTQWRPDSGVAKKLSIMCVKPADCFTLIVLAIATYTNAIVHVTNLKIV